MQELSPAHQTVEMADLEALRDLLDAGVDIHEEHGGLTLLHHAIDVEIDGHVQTGLPLHVDVTAYLLARGADPRRRSDRGTGVSAEHLARVSRHWLATCLIEEWLRGHPEVAPGD
ncbi:ankyrin repeat domain-containing protein [Actinophytocola sp.]|uniref:ankyrin repeat domain-containing protein n=1 Tax=Actinophytocola sp. TaxID=1872138 RepID=UPI002D7E3D4A|nr:ankyrin repeat domain-containing protein [Actinophytocola sp.]HET9140065.1 ankyrin repeat domain-containing protein [Actinophytocola sp.]